MSSDVKDSQADSTDILAWIGNDVRNPQGEELGSVTGFVREENGEISLVFVSYNERNVAVARQAGAPPEGWVSVASDGQAKQNR